MDNINEVQERPSPSEVVSDSLQTSNKIRNQVISTLKVYGGENGEYLSNKRDLVEALTSLVDNG